MRHAARTPLPPDFVICSFVAADVVWKIAKCRTKFRGERSLLQAFRSSLPVLCGYLALSLVLDGLVEFVPTAMNKNGKRSPKSITSHSKLTSGHFWRLLGRESVPKKRRPPLRIYQYFCTTGLIWGAICTPT